MLLLTRAIRPRRAETTSTWQAVDRRRLDLPANVTASERMAPLVIPPAALDAEQRRTSTQLPGRAAAVCHRRRRPAPPKPGGG